MSSGFAEKQLKKFGWKEGEGIGKSSQGIIDPIKASFKCDNAGGSTLIDGQTVESEKQKEETKPSLEEAIKNGKKIVSDHELYLACEGRTAHKGARHGIKMNGKLARIQEQEKIMLSALKVETSSRVADDEVEAKKKKKKKKSEEEVAVENNQPSENNVEIEEKADEGKMRKKKKRSSEEKEMLDAEEKANSEIEQQVECEIKKKKKKKKSRDNEENTETAADQNLIENLIHVEENKKNKKKSKNYDK